MPDRETTDALLARLRTVGAEPTWVETKAAVGGLPKDLVETVSAFANGSGGTVLLGVSEHDGFSVAEGFAPGPIRDALAGACADLMTPPLRGAVEIEAVAGGGHVVRLDVDELDPVEKPCFVTARGEYNGSFIRGGDGDRRLSRYEVTQLLLNRTQPVFDEEPVHGASLDHLSSVAVDGVLAHVRDRSPRTFRGVDREQALHMLGAVVEVDGTVRPTLAGLLCLGNYPQQFVPQLFLSFVSVAGTKIGDLAPDGARFLDNRTIDGTAAEILVDTMDALRRNMNRAAVIRGLGREDRYDYPLEVIRELVANALMHRDYSPDSRGTQVQVELYVDRLVITSPGGLHGNITTDALTSGERLSTSRNATLAKLLADVPMPDVAGETISDNRGSGLVRVMNALRSAGMSPPKFDVTIGRTRVTIPRTALLSPETIEWIARLGAGDLSDTQHLALAMMRNTGSASNAMLQTWGVDPGDAGRALRELVELGFAERSGGRRYATYHLTSAARSEQTTLPVDDRSTPTPQVEPGGEPGASLDPDVARVLDAIRAGHVTTRSLMAQLDLGYQPVLRRLNLLRAAGLVERSAPAKSSKQSYRITDQGETR